MRFGPRGSQPTPGFLCRKVCHQLGPVLPRVPERPPHHSVSHRRPRRQHDLAVAEVDFKGAAAEVGKRVAMVLNWLLHFWLRVLAPALGRGLP